MDELEAQKYRQDIGGYSNDILPYYERIAQWVPNDGKLVEVGVYFGRSAVYMAEQLQLLNKNVEFYGVDVFPFPWPLNGHKFNFLQMKSVEAAQKFGDESLDFVFIDADHSYEAVVSDIQAWLPKIKKGGIISGHDYNDYEFESFDPFYKINFTMEAHLGVVRAVDEAFGKDKVKLATRTVWEIVKE